MLKLERNMVLMSEILFPSGLGPSLLLFGQIMKYI